MQKQRGFSYCQKEDIQRFNNYWSEWEDDMLAPYDGLNSDILGFLYEEWKDSLKRMGRRAPPLEVFKSMLKEQLAQVPGKLYKKSSCTIHKA